MLLTALNLVCALWLVALTAGWIRLRRVIRDIERYWTHRELQLQLDAEARRREP